MMSSVHDFWNDSTIHALHLREHCDLLLPGEIAITWYQGPNSRELVLSGNQADDFLEKYRAAPDPETKELVMLRMVEVHQ
jgi:hypothetical protein